MRRAMTDEDYEKIIGQVAAEFHDKFISHPDREDGDTMEIAVEYTTFVLSRFSKLVEEYQVGQTESN